MNKMINRASIVIFSTIVLLFGCSEEFLDTDLRGGTPEEDFYKTDLQATQAVMAIYDVMQGMNAQDWNSMWFLKTLQSDELLAGGSSSGDQPPFQELNEFRHGSGNPVITFNYSMLYFGVNRANKIIDQVQPDTDVKKQVIAEAKALRAILYFELATLWGRVPLVIHELKPNEYAQPRAQLDAIWAQIEKDLTDAIAVLPVKGDYSAPDKARVSKGTAQAMLGKAHLYQKEYSAAAVALQAVIDSKQYKLLTDFSKILRKASEFGDESVFEISYSSDQKYDWGNFPWGNGRRQENNIHWQLAGPRGDGYFSGGTTGLIAGWGFGNPTAKMYQAFVDAGDETRRIHSVMSEAELRAQGGDLRLEEKDNPAKPYDQLKLPYNSEGYVRLKYGTWADETDAPVNEVNYGTNLRLIRYADVLLMAAEAYALSGNEGKAQEYLNDVRERVDLEPISPSGTALFDAIKTERRLELAFEGHRFLDLVRWGDAQTVLGSQGFQKKNELLPIPEQEMNVNPQMKGDQNDGY